MAAASHAFAVARDPRYERRSYADVRLLDRLIDAAGVVTADPL